jgi:alpha-D-ribose 1-methylphosphonate 5-triphosphate synthase subunit PhnH
MASPLSRELPFAFTNPSQDSQLTFRTLLEAMASPGKVHPLPGMRFAWEGWGAGLVQILLTLADHETAVWVAPAIETEEAKRFLRLGPGCRITRDPAVADFAVARIEDVLAGLGEFAAGTPLYPDQSTTLLLWCRSLRSEGEEIVSLRGPGIPKGTDGSTGRTLCVEGATRGFWEQVAANHARYPLGVDILFVSSDSVAALPRSTRVEWSDACT